MQVLNFSEFRKNLKTHLDKVTDDHDLIIVSRSNKKNVAVIPLEEYNAMKETLYLLSSPANAKRLRESIEEMKKGKFLKKKLTEE